MPTASAVTNEPVFLLRQDIKQKVQPYNRSSIIEVSIDTSNVFTENMCTSCYGEVNVSHVTGKLLSSRVSSKAWESGKETGKEKEEKKT